MGATGSAAKVRAEAARAVQEVLGGRSLDVALGTALPAVGDRDRGLLSMLAYGCIRHHWQLRDSARAVIRRTRAEYPGETMFIQEAYVRLELGEFDEALRLLEVQRPGRKRITAAEFAGQAPLPGRRFE